MKHYLTPERFHELKNDLNRLKTSARAEVAERLKRAKELGDLSENSEYIEAKEEQERVERRILELEDTLKNASLITKPETNTDTIQIGSTFEVEKGGAVFKFTILGSSETRPEAGFISNESPLGRAFLGRKEGDVVKVKVPAGEVTYKIVKVE